MGKEKDDREFSGIIKVTFSEYEVKDKKKRKIYNKKKFKDHKIELTGKLIHKINEENHNNKDEVQKPSEKVLEEKGKRIKEIFIPKSPSEFWTFTLSIPILLSIAYFIVDACYKIIMGNRFNLPNEYFSINFKNTIFWMICSIIIIPLLILLNFKPNNDSNKVQKNNECNKVNLIKIITLILFCYITVILVKVENTILYILIYIFFLFLAFYIFIILLEKKCIKIGTLILFIFFTIIKIFTLDFFEKLLKEYNVYSCIKKIILSIKCISVVIDIPYEYFFSIIIPILIVNIFSFHYNKNMIKNENKKNTFFLIFFFQYYFILLGFFLYLMPKILSEKTDYEIFYKDNKPKVIITIYTDKYLIADCDIYQDTSIIIINTENYEFVDISSDKIENIQYKDFKYVYINKEGKIVKNLLKYGII